MLLTTHEDLLKHKGAKVTCEIEGTKIDNARIQVEDGEVFICQNEKSVYNELDDTLGYMYAWFISGCNSKYGSLDDEPVTNITLIEEPKFKFYAGDAKVCHLNEVEFQAKPVEEPKLPRYFAIKKCDNPLWKKYIEWLNEKAGTPGCWIGSDNAYYGYKYMVYIRKELRTLKQDGVEVITLEEWNEIVNGETMNFINELDKRTGIPTLSSKKPKLTYQTIYKRSDGVEFTEGYIDGESIESWQERRKNHLSEANKITGKIREYNKLFK